MNLLQDKNVIVRIARRAFAFATVLAAAAAFLAPIGSAQYPVASGTLGSSSSEVSPGATVNVSGGGFVPGGRVSIFLRSDPILLDTVAASATGRIDIDVEIPESVSPGTHTLEARGPAAGGGTLVLATTIEVLGAQASGLPNTGLSLVPFVLAGGGATVAGVALLLVGRRVRRR